MSLKQPLAFSYLRFSSSGQIGNDSVRRQLELSTNYAKQHNLDLVENMQDLGISAFKGLNAKRGALSVFIEKVDNGQIPPGSYLIFENWDRLARTEPMQAFTQFANLINKGIVLITLQDNQRFDAESIRNNVGQLYTTIGGMCRAHEESKTKSDRLKASWTNKRNIIEHRKLTNQCPSWLKLSDDKTKFIEIPEKVNTIKKIFELSINGMGTYSICKYLNSNTKLYPPNDVKKGWYKSFITKILTSPAVHGQYTPHIMMDGKRKPTDKPIENYFPVIIEEDTFLLCQFLMQSRAVNGGRIGDTFNNIFHKLIVCGFCGGTVCFRHKGTGEKSGKLKLRCSNSERNHGCKAMNWNYEDFEQSFFSFIKELDLNAIFTKNESVDLSTTLNNRLIALEAKLIVGKEKLSKIVDLLIDSSPVLQMELHAKSEKIISDNAQIKAEIQATKQQLLTITNEKPTSDIKNTIAEYTRLIENKSNDEIKEIRLKIHNEIKNIIKYIKFENHEIYVVGDDIDDELSNELIRKRYKTEKEQVDYLLSKTSARFYNEWVRTYQIVFKNGTTRVVFPRKQRQIEFKKPIFKKYD